MIDCRVTPEGLEAGALIAQASNPASGAVATFVGTSRDTSSARPGTAVTLLEYEAYVPMAEMEMKMIAAEACERFDLQRVIAHHRVGVVPLGQPAVVVVVASAHRAPAFEGCRYVIEELKRRVPIWKKEVFTDGSEWVNARP